MHQRQRHRSRCSTRGGRLPGSRRRQRSGRSGTGSLGEWEGKLESRNRWSTRAARRLESLEEAETKWKRRGWRQQNRARLPKKSNCSADIQVHRSEKQRKSMCQQRGKHTCVVQHISSYILRKKTYPFNLYKQICVYCYSLHESITTVIKFGQWIRKKTETENRWYDRIVLACTIGSVHLACRPYFFSRVTVLPLS